MKNLRIWQKLALIGIVFMVPLAGVTYSMASSPQSLGADLARRELLGLEYYLPAAALARDLQFHRGLSMAVLAGDASYKDRLTAKTADVEADIKNMDAIDSRLGDQLQTSARWAALSAACRDLLRRSHELSVQQSFDEHGKLINDTILLIGVAGDTSGLRVDTNIATRSLITALISVGWDFSGALGDARDAGTIALITKQSTPEQTERARGFGSLLSYMRVRVSSNLERGFNSTEHLDPQLRAHSQQAMVAMTEAVGLAIRRARGTEMPAEAYYTQMSHGMDALYELGSELHTYLVNSIHNREVTYRRQYVYTFAWAAVGLLVVALVGGLIMRDIIISLRSVVKVADRIAVGDLDVDIPGQARKDEIGVMARAFTRMVAALKDTVGLAERIAGGDLTVKIAPRSDHDVMGHALANMVDRLSTLMGDVNRSGVQVNTSVNDIAATARQQQATAHEIAATTTEISATSREISATSKELVRTMSEVAVVADQTAALAGNGQNGLTHMADTMQHVMAAASSINAKLNVLNEKAGNINQVVTTITKVADQTNLLSLNAAIEAEKAGEYGRGFSVVATEIRRLADQTAVATYDIEQMVKEIQSAVSAGVMGMDKFSEEVRRGMQDVQEVGNQLTQIIHQVQALAPRCEAVSEGMQAQATGAEQITLALSQLSEAAQQTVDSLRQSGQAIDGLNQAAIGMRTGVSRFKLVA